ncbi:unnamed protein product [Nesidiocoris tenuis]|uniref:Ig-like domain-containing protein n=1 Tax=Nesidiocoris tenuis TaxID=355587 RepID=A0A6H5GXN4_9HEMI|nr:unnamed protein product [Nesidiocoris tenuis]
MACQGIRRYFRQKGNDYGIESADGNFPKSELNRRIVQFELKQPDEKSLAHFIKDIAIPFVAWLRVDTQTILTIHGHVITKNHRIGVTHSDRRSWCLHIKEIRESDRGWYMCQINTDPMKSQVGFLDVVVPPDIVDVGTSTDMIVREGANVTFTCSASGSPAPNITWRREAGQTIPTAEGQEAPSIDGVSFNLTRINRLHMGAYLCIASNGWPPSVSKRIMLIVHFPPMIWIQNQLVGAMEGERMTLECLSEAFPKSINYWTRESGDIISQGKQTHFSTRCRVDAALALPIVESRCSAGSAALPFVSTPSRWPHLPGREAPFVLGLAGCRKRKYDFYELWVFFNVCSILRVHVVVLSTFRGTVEKNR